MNSKILSKSLALGAYDDSVCDGEDNRRRETAAARPTAALTEYRGLIRSVFRRHSVIALIEAGSEAGSGKICGEIAAELAALGHRVVIVRGEHIVAPAEHGSTIECEPAEMRGVWYWPADGRKDRQSLHVPGVHGRDWLACLQEAFDCVLLDCPSVEAGGAELSAQADHAVLIAKAGLTSRRRIQQDCKKLRLRGVALLGCVLVERAAQ